MIETITLTTLSEEGVKKQSPSEILILMVLSPIYMKKGLDIKNPADFDELESLIYKSVKSN